MTGEQADLNVTVRAIMSMRKRDKLEAWFQYPAPPPVLETANKDFDPNYIAVQLWFQSKDNRDFVFNMVLNQEIAKQLNLMVGDKLTLKIAKESQ